MPRSKNTTPTAFAKALSCRKEIEAEYSNAAYRVEKLLNASPGAPDWLLKALVGALDEAAEIKGIEIWREDEAGTEGFDPEGLARLFGESRMLSLVITNYPKRRKRQ